MSDSNRTHRIRTNVSKDQKDQYVNVNLTQDYDILEILSLKIKTDNFYNLHKSKYGCLVGRILANNSVGIPNAKISVFIKQTDVDANHPIMKYLYPYTDTKTKNMDGIRYNLLPDFVDDKCHQNVGTFPNKRLVLDDKNVIEVYDTYYKYTATTNSAGDYMIFGLPVGDNVIHCELDLSDIGMLSQKPRDFFYKGYNHTQFENASQFKKSTELDSLTQIISQDNSVYVYSFWGDDDTNLNTPDTNQVKITRKDINVNYKFEPTCIFIGSLVADEKSQGFSKRCIPTDRMGKMDRLTTGAGTIEMIRKTPVGYTESFAVQGNDLIDGNGTWCYQIPMNLDFMKTDEFGNFVPAENEETGIPTRARVRFRVSLADYESDSANAHLCKILVPNNPQFDGNKNLNIDYEFGSNTTEDSFRDLFWNNVYTVKSYIPRIQYILTNGSITDRSKNFSGIKVVNANGSNNPIPYNNIRIQLTFLFIFQCIIFKSLILITKIINAFIFVVGVMTCGSGCNSTSTTSKKDRNEPQASQKDTNACNASAQLRYVTLDGSMCPSLEGWYMALGAKQVNNGLKNLKRKLVNNTLNWAKGGENNDDTTTVGLTQTTMSQQTSVSDSQKNWFNVGLTDAQTQNLHTDKAWTIDKTSSEHKYNPLNSEISSGEEVSSTNHVFVSGKEDYFVKCVELQFAMEYEVIQFDFYNDWMNGMLYFPRWFAELKKRKRVDKVIACNENFRGNYRYIVQQCAVEYNFKNGGEIKDGGCGGEKRKCHKKTGRQIVSIFKHNGVVQSFKNMYDKYLYYLRPVEVSIINNNKKKINLFATDLVLLGSVLDCNKYGIPTAVGYPSSSYVLPPPTGQIVDENQEMRLSGYADSEFDNLFMLQNKKTADFREGDEIELSGIDWGYDPFSAGDTSKNDTTIVKNQRSGHFLEIGCLHSYSNSKSCINLSRICEIGGEIAQSHYYDTKNSNGTFVGTTGIISTREVIGPDIRMKFASLNSKWLKTVTDDDTTYLQYDFIPFTPTRFDGAAKVYNGTFDSNMLEEVSNSYRYYRFGFTNKPQMGEIIDRYLKTSGSIVSFPMYENSFYFYFGLKDGNTAIDRLYTEYFSECTNGETETIVDENGEAQSAVIKAEVNDE